MVLLNPRVFCGGLIARVNLRFRVMPQSWAQFTAEIAEGAESNIRTTPGGLSGQEHVADGPQGSSVLPAV